MNNHISEIEALALVRECMFGPDARQQHDDATYRRVCRVVLASLANGIGPAEFRTLIDDVWHDAPAVARRDAIIELTDDDLLMDGTDVLDCVEVVDVSERVDNGYTREDYVAILAAHSHAYTAEGPQSAWALVLDLRFHLADGLSVMDAIERVDRSAGYRQ